MKLVLGKRQILCNFFLLLIFAYFLTISMELLYVSIYLFKPKLNHLISTFLFFAMMAFGKICLIDKKFLFCFALIFCSLFVSSFFSLNFFRSFAYDIVYFFMFVVFFILPINVMRFFDSKLVLKLYLLSFVVVGLYASMQFILSLFGIFDPFALQTVGGAFLPVARGQALAYEPSFYALYAIPFIAFFNTKWLLSQKKLLNFKMMAALFGMNILLLVSTSTGGFFSYFVFVLVLFGFSLLRWVRKDFGNLRRQLGKLVFLFSAIFMTFAAFFYEFFRLTFFKFFYFGLHHWSFADRWKGIVDAWSVFCEAPLFGLGLGGVGPYLYLMHDYGHSDVTLESPTLDMFDVFDPSNVLTEVLASLGICGLAALIILGTVVYNLFLSALKDARVSYEEKVTIFSMLVSIIVMVVCLQFNQGLFRPYIWLHTGLCVGYVLKVKSILNAKSKKEIQPQI